jgi:hypothetical protein
MRRLKTLYLIALACLIPSTATKAANSYFVYGIKTDFPLSETDRSVHDLYVNLGTTQGVKTGTLLDVYRTISTVDDVNKKVSEKISFKIAQIKVIHAEEDIAVARILEMKSPAETPLGDIPAVVIGDMVEVARK